MDRNTLLSHILGRPVVDGEISEQEMTSVLIHAADLLQVIKAPDFLVIQQEGDNPPRVRSYPFVDAFCAVRDTMKELNAADGENVAGAMLAEFFLRNPDVDAFELTLGHDVTFDSYSATLGDVQRADGERIDEDELVGVRTLEEGLDVDEVRAIFSEMTARDEMSGEHVCTVVRRDPLHKYLAIHEFRDSVAPTGQPLSGKVAWKLLADAGFEEEFLNDKEAERERDAR
jgi:hypothetical protein